MTTMQLGSGIIQNEGAVDRVVRNLIGWGLIGVAVVDLLRGSSFSWHGYAILIALYPLFTSMLGWDPIYQMMHARSCNVEGKDNRCGSFPYEVTSVVGKSHPCNSDENCTVYGTEEQETKQKARM